MSDPKVIKHVRKLSIGWALLASFFFTLSLYFAYRAVLSLPIWGDLVPVDNFLMWTTLFIFCFFFGRMASEVSEYIFDFREKKYKVIRRYGPFSVGSWKRFSHLKTITIDEADDAIYEVIFGFHSNKKKIIAQFEAYESALHFANLAKKALKVKLVDKIEING